MNRDGLVIAGGTIGIIRGAYGSFMGLSNLPDVGYIDGLLPGFGLVYGFELLVSLGVLVISVWAIIRANAQASASDIVGWGVAILVCGVVDLLATFGIIGVHPESIAAGLGSVAVLGLIGGLLIAGGNRLGRVGAAS